MERKLRYFLVPPHGIQVNKAIGIFSLWIGIPRILSVFPWFPAVPYNTLRFADPWVYGLAMTLIGILLLYASYTGECCTLRNRIVAGIGFVAWTMLAVATVSWTSFGINITIAASLLTEVWKINHD